MALGLMGPLLGGSLAQTLAGGPPEPASRPEDPLNPEMNVKPSASPKRMGLKQAVQEFTSDFMFTLAHSLAATASQPGGRGTQAGLAAALQGPMLRKTLIAQQQEEQQKRDLEIANMKSVIAERESQIADREQKAKEAGVTFITKVMPDGSKRRVAVKVEPLTGLQQQFGGPGLEVEPAPAPELTEVVENGQRVLRPKVAGAVLGPAEEKKPDMTPEEAYIDLALQVAGNGKKLAATQELKVRADAKKEWANLSRDPDLADLNKRMRELQIQIAEQNLRGEGGLSPKQLTGALQMSSQLKSHPAYIDMLDIQSGMQGVEVGLSQKNGFGDITAINAFQRMVDPGATVREGDVALLQGASSFVQRILSEYPIEKLRTGAKLPDEVRKQMMKAASELYGRRAKNYNDSVGRQYKTLAEAAKIPFAYVGQDFEARLTAPADDGMIDVQIPGQPTGKIHASQWDNFLKRYPNATRK